MLAIVCPGQGSQTPGFLSPWLELPGLRDRLSWLGAVAGIDLVGHGTESDAETIKDTAVAQPLIVGAGLVCLLSLFEQPSEGFRAVSVGAGHSVGEITAAAATGVITAEQAMVFVRERGRAMAAASAVTPTGMAAVLGGDPDDVLATLERHGLAPANVNGAGQVVAAGTMEQIESLRADPPAKTRVIPLQVAGAFHTTHMAPAVDLLAGYARAISTHDTRTTLLSNADGAVVHAGPDVLGRLVSQVSNPVRWDLCMRTMTDMGVTGLIEIPPAGTLVGLAKRAMPGVETLALKTPDDLDAARRMVREHAAGDEGLSGDPRVRARAWRLVVSPSTGQVRTGDLVPGATLDPGAVVARVETQHETHPVIAHRGGQLVEWLVEDGDPVSPGQPLLRLHPISSEGTL